MRLIDADALQSEYMRYHDGKRIVLVDVAPTIEPEPQWIPCSERLPEDRLYVLVTYKYEYGFIDMGIVAYSEEKNEWDTPREVVAWMPLPEPYKEDTHE